MESGHYACTVALSPRGALETYLQIYLRISNPPDARKKNVPGLCVRSQSENAHAADWRLNANGAVDVSSLSECKQQL